MSTAQLPTVKSQIVWWQWIFLMYSKNHCAQKVLVMCFLFSSEICEDCFIRFGTFWDCTVKEAICTLLLNKNWLFRIVFIQLYQREVICGLWGITLNKKKSQLAKYSVGIICFGAFCIFRIKLCVGLYGYIVEKACLSLDAFWSVPAVCQCLSPATTHNTLPWKVHWSFLAMEDKRKAGQTSPAVSLMCWRLVSALNFPVCL